MDDEKGDYSDNEYDDEESTFWRATVRLII